MGEASDNIWFVQMQQGDPNGLRSLFDCYYTVLCRYAYTLTGDKILSEDIAQGIFIYIWEHREHITITASVKTYLFTAIRNKSLNSLRNTNRFSPLHPDISLSAYEDMSVEADELSCFIEEAVQSLPEKCREIFQLSRNDELSYKEIAERKGISPKTVESQIHLAIKKLRKYLSIHYRNGSGH